MLTLAQAQKMLRDRTLKEVERATGLKYFVLRNIKIGQHDGIKAIDLQVLSDYLQKD